MLILPVRGWRLWRRGGARAIRSRLRGASQPAAYQQYGEWCQRYDTLSEAARTAYRQRLDTFPTPPLISVLMPVYATPPTLLDAAIQSVRSQLYPHWELCIADDASPGEAQRHVIRRHAQEDARIRFVFREDNGHIAAASNSALALASGTYVALLDHDDLLAETALFHVAEAIIEDPRRQLIYSDEDRLDVGNVRVAPYFKGGWNYDLFLCHNLISHLGVYAAPLVREAGGFRPGFDGAQDYDLALRCVEHLSPAQIHHIPRVLYHWRMVPGSTAHGAAEKPYAAEAGARSIREHLERTGKSGVVEIQDNLAYRVRYPLPDPCPTVTLVLADEIPGAGFPAWVVPLLQSPDLPAVEVVAVRATEAAGASAPPPAVRLLHEPGLRTLGDRVNYGARHARGELLCILRPGLEPLTTDWLQEMVSLAAQADVGCVGARIWCRGDRLHDAGLILGVGGGVGYAQRGLPRGETGYMHRGQLRQGCSAVSARCLMVRRALWDAVGGFATDDCPEPLWDADFCLKVSARGYRNVWTPYADWRCEEDLPIPPAIPDDGPPNTSPARHIVDHWHLRTVLDPFYSPNLTLQRDDCSLAFPPRAATPWTNDPA